MSDIPETPSATLSRAGAIAIKNGMHYVFTGNIHDPPGQATYCHNCQAALIGRDGYEITFWHLTAEGNCDTCGALCAGVFEPSPGQWGSKRMPVSMNQSADGADLKQVI